MSSKVKEAKTKKPSEEKKAEESLYLNEDVRNFAFSDYVRIKSYPRGLLFSFGKRHPEDQKYILFEEILLPFDVAVALQKIIGEQIDYLVSRGLLEIRKPTEGEGEKK
jgi:hypothetical protein